MRVEQRGKKLGLGGKGTGTVGAGQAGMGMMASGQIGGMRMVGTGMGIAGMGRRGEEEQLVRIGDGAVSEELNREKRRNLDLERKVKELTIR